MNATQRRTYALRFVPKAAQPFRDSPKSAQICKLNICLNTISGMVYI
jgi:hypothetical protein